jgi:predicted nuclease of predicted toxin-antitoxin system
VTGGAGLKLYLDEQLSERIAEGLRAAGVDVVTTREARHVGRGDPEQLAYARAEGRALVTMNVRDFRALLQASPPPVHAGVLFLEGWRGNEFEGIVAALRTKAEQYPKGLAGQVGFVRRPPRRPPG